MVVHGLKWRGGRMFEWSAAEVEDALLKSHQTSRGHHFAAIYTDLRAMR